MGSELMQKLAVPELLLGRKYHARLVESLARTYAARSPKSALLNERAKRTSVDGGSHALRLIEPFPPRITRARGAWVEDEDGHRILDFWQGHTANLLGHNPEVVTSALCRAFQEGSGLQSGFTDRLQVETAEILCRRTGAERARFTTSGTLATMYAALLARAFTGREVVMKVGGGWHGGQPWSLKGVRFGDDGELGFDRVDSEGLPRSVTDNIIVTRFNDPQRLVDQFRRHGNRVACFLVEPFIGVGGYLPATREFIETARDLTEHYGALLIFDEVISGFRFRAGDAGAFFSVRPDLATFAKVIGGGMPVAAVCGRADVMALAGREGGSRVRFSGGTYSAHPASLLAAKTMMEYLVLHEAEIYLRLGELGDLARRTVRAAFEGEGIPVHCTGQGNGVLPPSSLCMVLFPYDTGTAFETPEEVHDPAVCDLTLGGEALQLALLIEDVHVVHGLGAVSAAHTEEDILFLGEACRRVARRFKAFL
jgi:glutamate-1-semialdehyde 2,1-aminomutase